ncbi:tetratricopeptide repeat protein [Wenzhouxiangella limi]|uniref:Tetratricopeptide repeat protein n=1 Tax=Wenzhouxiangella limi TaxID=2707351 RepID=A0A845UWT1_9GAMM|nr:tetratricopeptide repeat protein [Wenzhouxiangella limi]NDY96313.1 tetratricopeptide repeat protein [Wenzhouxiangella limi]
MNDTTQRKISWLAAVTVVAATIVAYWPSFEVPFYLDDYLHFIETPALHDAGDVAGIQAYSPARFIANWTLAANYSVHGEDVFGYHLVNLLIHLLAGLGLWLLLSALLRSRALDIKTRPWLRWVPLIATAIFLLHPLQTQAVTYIIQRHASLAAMFYLLSLSAFAWGRLRGDWRLFILTSLAGVLAFFSKQSAATLPLALLLVELLFFRRLGPKSVVVVAAAAALTAVLVAWVLHWPRFDILGTTREVGGMARLDYLVTQFGVLWHYIGQFFLIGEQRLEYDFALVAMDWRMGIVLPALGHLALLILGFLTWRRAPLVAFGILFYYLAHAVESSVIPIRDLAFEHRTYLPNAGLAVALVAGLATMLAGQSRTWQRSAVAGLVLLMGFTLYQTWARNSLWVQPEAFLQANTRLAPDSPRAWTNLGRELLRQEGRTNEALSAIENALTVAAQSTVPFDSSALIILAMAALHERGENFQLLKFAQHLDASALSDQRRFDYHALIGGAFLSFEIAEQAQAHLSEAVSIRPDPNVIAALAHSELMLGHYEQAFLLSQQVLQVIPDHPVANAIASRFQLNQGQ